MDMGYKIISTVLVALTVLMILINLISASLQNHYAMMQHDGCASTEICVFHQTTGLFGNNVFSTAPVFELATFILTSLGVLILSIPPAKLTYFSFDNYYRRLLKISSGWNRYKRRSTDKLKIHLVFSY